MEITCNNCGACVPTYQLNCIFCQASIVPNRKLDEEQTTTLTNFIEGIEVRLNSQKNRNEHKAIWSFLILFLIYVGVILVLLLAFRIRGVIWLMASGLIAFPFLAIFGGMLERIEHKTLEEIYQHQLERDIENFLEQNDFYRYEFDILASKTLAEKSKLRPFLFRLE